METLEVNKLVGAILVGGLVAMVTGAVAHMLVAPKHHEGGEVAAISSGAAPEPSAAPAPAALEPVSPLLAKADPHKGQQIAMKCQACHDFTKGGPNKIGPNLWGIVGSKPAEVPGYSFSDAMKAREDKPWTYEALNDFPAAPRSFVPGTKMTFAGLPKVEDRADVIAYLRTLRQPAAPAERGRYCRRDQARRRCNRPRAGCRDDHHGYDRSPRSGRHRCRRSPPLPPRPPHGRRSPPLPPRAPRPPHRLPRASPHRRAAQGRRSHQGRVHFEEMHRLPQLRQGRPTRRPNLGIVGSSRRRSRATLSPTP
jgi:cytochrome c